MDIDKPKQDITAESQHRSANTTSDIHLRLSRITTTTSIDHSTTPASYSQSNAQALSRPVPLSVRFATENAQLELPPGTPNSSSAKLLSHASVSSSISSSSLRPSVYTSTTIYNSSSTASTSSPPPQLSPAASTSPEPVSPPSSAFVSASASPFSPPLAAAVDVPEINLDQATLQPAPVIPSPKHPPHAVPTTVQKSIASSAPRTTFNTVDDTFLELQFVKPTSTDTCVRGQLPKAISRVEQAPSSATDSDVPVRQHSEYRAPPTPIISTSPSTSFRPRTCDVYIGMHGWTPSLSRFSKWLRAELEFHGIACFLADRARYTDPRVHDIARRIMQSCTFGVIVINKKSFKNMYSVEELQIFLERKNLVPLFFDLAPADCMARDIVERRGEVWEKEGGDLWRAFGGKEREWRDAVDGLSRIEEWKLEAFNGNWRDCILRAVSLLGTRIGRRSVAERERARKQRVEREEFPFPRNAQFVGREKELRAVENLLFGNANKETQQLNKQQHPSKEMRGSKQSVKGHQPNRKQISSQSERWSGREDLADPIVDNFESRRRSDADMWHNRYMMKECIQNGDVGRRKSDSDRWQSFVAGGGLDVSFPRRNNLVTSFASGPCLDTDASVFATGMAPPCTASEEPGPLDRLLNASGRKKASGKASEIKEVSENELPRSMTTQGSRVKSRSSKEVKQRSFASSAKRKRSQNSRSKSESALGNSSMQDEDGESALSPRAAIIACVCGGAGMGKTELALEFAYRFYQRYRMVLWIGGEARYLRQNYLNLSVLLGLDVGTESQVGPERGRIRTFEEQEREALQRVRRELERDVPYLLVIDNLESERDWWDRKDVVELLPRPGSGGATHVIVTTRLLKVASMPNSVKLLYLSSVEALSLMRGKREFSVQELDALREMEERLDRSTFGLGLVGKLLAELPSMVPTVLLEKVNKGFPDSWPSSMPREDTPVKNNSFLLKLLGVCFSFLEQLGGPRKLALRMASIGGWCAPFPIPVSLLASAAVDIPEHSGSLVTRVFRDSVLFCGTTQTKRAEAEAGSLLVRLGIARSCSRRGWIVFDDIIQLYAKKRGGVAAARAMVQAIKKRGVISQHSEHFWAACFLVLGFANDPVVVDMRAVELLSFIKKGALQLAFRAFTTYSRCRAALELLRLCTNMLEDVEKSFVSQTQDWWGRSLCWRARSSTQNYMVQQAAGGMRAGALDHEVDEYVWEEATLLKASLLETRAKLLLKGGQFDTGEEICRTSISIRTVMLGEHHPDTISAQETLAKLVRARSST